MDIFRRGPKFTAVTIFLICGTISTFAYKLMGSQYVDEGDNHRKFFHPYMQSFTMFVGESICLILFFSNRQKNEIPLEEGKTPHQFYIFFIPAFSDGCSSVLQYMALNFISGSTYLMFKGASIVTTVIFSKILLGMIIQKRHVVGCGSAIFGLVIVGASGFLSTSESDDHSNQVLGYSLMLISLVFNGYLHAYEQFLMRKHSINPLQMAGWQGCFGMVIIAFIALTLSIVPCNFKQKLCVYDSHGNKYFQRVDQFFSQIGTYWILAMLVVIGILTISAYNLNGVRITKLFDALTRSLLNTTKTAITWIIGMIVTFSVGDNAAYQLQSKELVVNLVKGVGFAFIVLGTLIYSKVIFKMILADREQAQPINEINENRKSLLQSADE